jgi:hypothetical protein
VRTLFLVVLGALAAECGWANAVGSISADFFNGGGAQLLTPLSFDETSELYFATIDYIDPENRFKLTGDVIADRITDQINYSFHADDVNTQAFAFVLDFSIPFDAAPLSNAMYSDITANGTASVAGFTAGTYNPSGFFVTASGAASESRPTGLDNGTACSISGAGSNTCDYTGVLEVISSPPNNPINVDVAFVVPVDANGDPNDFGVDGSLGFGAPEPASFLLLTTGALLLLRRRAQLRRTN